jgi:neutral amino acid transport system permease protein
VPARIRIALVLAVLAAALVLAPAALAQTSIGGFARSPSGKPLAGVAFSVARGGRTVGSARTDARGEWRVTVPGGGTYAVSVDPHTIPHRFVLRTGQTRLPAVQVQAGETRFVIFPLVPRGQAGKAPSGPSAASQIATLALQGVRLGMIIAMAAIGLSLIYGITGLVNFAQGELVTFGGLVAWWLSSWGGGPDWPLVPSALIAVCAGGLLGWLLDRGLFAPLRRRRTGNVSLIVVTIGLSLALQNLYLIAVGGEPVPFDQYTIQQQVGPGPFTLAPKDWLIIALSATILVAIAVVLQRTRFGTAMRAVADNRDLAAASGIAVPRVVRATWVGAGALAATGGVFLGVSEAVSWSMGLDILLLMFAAVVLGGIGTAYGPMAGALAIGVVTQVATYWVDPQVKNAIAFLVLIAVLLVRPQGILGRRERVG